MTTVQNFTNNSTDFSKGAGICPKWAIYAFSVFFLTGSCINLLESFALLRSKRTGVLSIILQINLADTLLFFVALLELFTSYHQTWSFTSQTCMMYSGTEVLANTLVVYLLICLNFHVITFSNLSAKNNSNPLTNFNESSSSECLVTRSDNRIVNIDYRKRKTDVPVRFPSVFLWVLCLSVSLPKYVLSSTVEIQEKTLCIVLQSFYSKMLFSLLSVFCVALPSLLLLVSLFILLYKRCRSPRKGIDHALTKQLKEVKGLLRCCILLSIFYKVTSFQRNLLGSAQTIRELFVFENYYCNNFFNVYQVMLHYSGTCLRGVIFYLAAPEFKEIVKDKLFCRNKKSSK